MLPDVQLIIEDENGCLNLITPGAKEAMEKEGHSPSPSGYITEEEGDEEEVMDLDAAGC